MSRFKKLSHAVSHCQYHIVWVPKYRLRTLTGQVGEEVRCCIDAFSEHLKCEVVERNVQIDHVHLIVVSRDIQRAVPSKNSIGLNSLTSRGSC